MEETASDFLLEPIQRAVDRTVGPNNNLTIKGLKRMGTSLNTPTNLKAKYPTPKQIVKNKNPKSQGSGKTPTTPKFSAADLETEDNSQVQKEEPTEEDFFILPPDMIHRFTVNMEKLFLSFRSPGTANDLSVLVNTSCDIRTLQRKVFYFEVSLLRRHNGSTFSVGLGSKTFFNHKKLVGLTKDSYGYHCKKGIFLHDSKKKVHISAPYSQGDTVGCGIVLPQRHIFFTRNGEFIGKLLEIPISSEEEPENEISDNEKFIYQKGVGISRFSWKGDKHATIDTSMSSELYLREKRGRTIDKKIISELCAEKPKIDPNLYYPIISSTSPAIVEVNLGQIPFKFDISKLNFDEPILERFDVDYLDKKIEQPYDEMIKHQNVSQAIEAIKTENLDLFRKSVEGLTKDDIDAITNDIDSVGLIHIASLYRNSNTKDIISLLIEKGAEAFKVTNHGTALHTASKSGNLEVVFLLLEQLKKQEHDEHKRLEKVNEKYHKETAIDLLYSQIDILSPIILRIRGILYEQEAQQAHVIDNKNFQDLKAIYEALRQAGAKANLHTAALFGDMDRLKECIEVEHKYIDRQDSHGYSVMYIAVARNDLEMIRYLTSHGAALDLDIDLPPLVLLAAVNHKIETIELLAQLGGNMNAEWKKHHVLEILMLSKASGEDGNELSNAEEVKLNTMRILCRLGSDPCRYNKDLLNKSMDKYRPAFQIALESRDLRAFKLFCEYSDNIENIEGDRLESLLQMCILAQSSSEDESKVLEEMAKLLLSDTKIFVDYETEDGNTALHLASCLGKLELTTILVEFNANVHAKNLNSLTPFMLAVLYNHFDIASFLVIKAGALSNSKTNDNKTILHLLFDSKELERLNSNPPSLNERFNLAKDCIEKLRVNPNLLDDTHKTARDYAIRYEMIKFYPLHVSYNQV